MPLIKKAPLILEVSPHNQTSFCMQEGQRKCILVVNLLLAFIALKEFKEKT